MWCVSEKVCASVFVCACECVPVWVWVYVRVHVYVCANVYMLVCVCARACVRALSTLHLKETAQGTLCSGCRT